MLLFALHGANAGTPDSVVSYLKITLSPSAVKQGQSFTVFVDSTTPLTKIKMRGFERKIPLYRIWHKEHKYLYRSFVGVPAWQNPGQYKIVVEAEDQNQEQLRIYGMMEVTEGHYKIQRINLTKKKASLLNVEALKKEGSVLGSRLKLRTRKVFFASNFIRPASGKISSVFGSRRQYNDEEFSSYHKGLDFANVTGTPVKAANGGKVSLAEDMKSNGRIILINHGHGITTIYSHLSEIVVKEGQWVKQGQVIGKMGSTGISSGPHLHFGISVNNIRVDPLQWLDSDIVLYYNARPEP